MKKTICICGGGNLGQVTAGYLSAHAKVNVNVLTRRPELWSHSMVTSTFDGKKFEGTLNIVSDSPKKALENVDIVLLCVPGTANVDVLNEIKPYISNKVAVGCVFASSGFFFQAKKIFNDTIPLWGFQRVPFISRIVNYGKESIIKGYRKQNRIAIENYENKEGFRQFVEDLFGSPTLLLSNYLEATFTNSNALLHPARMYSIFKNWQPGDFMERYIPFYEEWSDEASQLYINMDRELHLLIEKLPVNKDYLPFVLDYYESTDAASLTQKLKEIFANKGYASPMVETPQGWLPDINGRYFQEDLGLSLYYIYNVAKESNIQLPTISSIYEWGQNLIKK